MLDMVKGLFILALYFAIPFTLLFFLSKLWQSANGTLQLVLLGVFVIYILRKLFIFN